MVFKMIFMCGQVGDDDDVREGEAGRRCALEGDENFEEEAGKVKVIASMRMRIKIMWMSMWSWMRMEIMEMRMRMKCKCTLEGGNTSRNKLLSGEYGGAGIEQPEKVKVIARNKMSGYR